LMIEPAGTRVHSPSTMTSSTPFLARADVGRQSLPSQHSYPVPG
jgi:hypothetical protein